MGVNSGGSNFACNSCGTSYIVHKFSQVSQKFIQSVHRTDVIELLLHDAVPSPPWRAFPVNGLLLYASLIWLGVPLLDSVDRIVLAPVVHHGLKLVAVIQLLAISILALLYSVLATAAPQLVSSQQ